MVDMIPVNALEERVAADLLDAAPAKPLIRRTDQATNKILKTPLIVIKMIQF